MLQAGITPFNGSFDAGKNLKVATHSGYDASATWIVPSVSGEWVNLCSGDYSFSTQESTPLKWIPSEGKSLEVQSTMLIISNNVNMDQELHFKGINCGLTGTTNFDRKYRNLWDYVVGCDEYYEFADHKRLIWTYPSAIVIRSSYSGSIYITTNGFQTGTNAVVKLKCLSRIDQYF